MHKKFNYRWLVMLPAVMVGGLVFIAQSDATKNPSPADAGTLNGVPLIPAEGPDSQPITITPTDLQVHGFDVVRLAKGTEIGKERDFVVVVQGRGFQDAEAGPLVHLGEDILLDPSQVNQKGTEVYAMVPEDLASEFKSIEVRSLAVQNPGAMNRDSARWGRLPIGPGEFKAAFAKAKEARLSRGTYFLELNR